MHQYGLLVHRHKTKVNIGDYIQGIAVKQALGLSNFTFIDREDIAAYQGEKLRVVGQGWYCHTPGAWPPSPCIDYLPFGIHINPQSHAHFLKSDSLAALRTLAPIGCRDDITKEFLDAHDVASYFSSCLTLTINPSPIERRPEQIILVDANPIAIKLLPDHLQSLPVKSMSALIPHPSGRVWTHEELFEMAQERLDLYFRSAAVVVTSRLHALLPSLAMGIPCLWIERRMLDRRLDLARRYARSNIFPRPDSLGPSVGRVLDKTLHPLITMALKIGGSNAEQRIRPKMDMRVERERILADLHAARRRHGWLD